MTHYSLDITLQGLPRVIGTVSRGRWSLRKEENRYWHAQISFATKGKEPSKPLDHAEVLLTRYSSLLTTLDALKDSFACVLDALTHAKIIGGTPHLTYVWQIAKRKDARITIKVGELFENNSRPLEPSFSLPNHSLGS